MILFSRYVSMFASTGKRALMSSSKITLQRDTIDVSGQGQITIGQLPDDIDESNITWVPVRLYAASEGGLTPPTFAPNEVYPLYVQAPSVV